MDNLASISEAIAAAFSNAEVQKCIVHQIRISFKFVPWKKRKAVAVDLRLIYTVSSEAEGFAELERFAEKRDKKYPHISRSWLANWAELSTFYKYNCEIRTLIYTTNPIESYHRAVRMVMKSRGVFRGEEAVLKLMYLATQDTENAGLK